MRLWVGFPVSSVINNFQMFDRVMYILCILPFQEHRGLLNIRYPMEVSEEFSIVVSVELTLTKLNKSVMSLLDHNILILKSDKKSIFC